jgi:hypothetical protein
VFGEALGALYSDKHGLGVTCLRIGNFGEMPLDHRRLAIWLKPEDLVQLCRIGLDHPDIKFEIFYGASYNERSWWDNHRAYDLGYRPTGRAEDFREHAMAEQAKLKPDPVGDFYQGGAFCGMEFDGDKSGIIALRIRCPPVFFAILLVVRSLLNIKIVRQVGQCRMVVRGRVRRRESGDGSSECDLGTDLRRGPCSGHEDERADSGPR